MGHAAAYSPLAKHRYEETSAKSLGPVYRYRNYTNQIVVVNDPALQQEVRPQSLLHHLVMMLARSLKAPWLSLRWRVCTCSSMC